MAEKFDGYTDDDNTAYPVWGVNWNVQTFTPSVRADITSVKLKLFKTGNPAGNFNVDIHAVDGAGKPTGAALTSGSIVASTIAAGSPGSLVEITVTKYGLSADTKYAIVVSVPDGSAGNQIEWRIDSTELAYTGGTGGSSGDSGSTWTMNANQDAMFEVWGLLVILISVSDTISLSESISSSTTNPYTKRTKPSRGTYTKRTKPSIGTYTKRTKPSL